MANPLLLLPDFLLILLGFVVCRATALDRPVWEAAERLVYFLLFPVLLFNSIVKSPLQPAETVHLGLAGFATVATGVVVALGALHGAPSAHAGVETTATASKASSATPARHR